MNKFAIGITAFLLVADAFAMEELFVDVPQQEAKAVIERNELQYEELRWHSFPDRFRIARVNFALLEKVGSKFRISPFGGGPSITIRSLGIDNARWNGARLDDPKSEDELSEGANGNAAIADLLRGIFNTTQLKVDYLVRDNATGEYIPVAVDRNDRTVAESDQVFGEIPVVRSDANIVRKVYGTITIGPTLSGNGRVRSISIKALQHDPDIVVIYEWDNSKDHHLLEPPNDIAAFEETELGKHYKKLREDKAQHMRAVAERVEERARREAEGQE